MGGQSFVQSPALTQPLTHSSMFFGPTSMGQGLVLPLTSPSLPHCIYISWDNLILVWKVKVAEQWLSCCADFQEVTSTSWRCSSMTKPMKNLLWQ